MSYKALYRTYRPQTFDEVAGQKQIIQTLKNAINDNKIAHAYLFTGPRGTGKTTMAKLLAKALNCESEFSKPCDECKSCKDIVDGTHPDIIEIDAASNNGVDEVRNLIDKVKYAPIQGKYKVYIIDEVHMMSQGAFNALLKTLEEPPAHVVFILATTEPHKVLPTILSRCQRFDFGRISKSDIKERLQIVLDSEEINYKEDVLDLVSELCDGGMRDALSILDQAIAYSRDELTTQSIMDIYGLVSNKEKLELLQMISDGNCSLILEKINEYDEKGIDITRLTSNLIETIKEIIIYKSSASYSGLKIIDKENSYIFEGITNKVLFRMIDVLVEAMANYRKSSSLKPLFEIACLKMCDLNKLTYEEKETYKVENTEKAFAKNSISPEKVENTQKEEVKTSYQKAENTLNNNEEKIDVSRETKEEVKTVEIVKEREINEEECLNVLVQATKDNLLKAKQQWIMLPKYLQSASTGKIAAILSDGMPVAACDNVIVIAYNSQAYINVIESGNTYEEINNFLKAFYNSDVKCICLTTSEFATLREKYMTLRQLGKLPKPIPIVIRKKVSEVSVEKEDKVLEYGKKVFGDNLVIEEE